MTEVIPFKIRWLSVIASARSRRFYGSIGDCLETVYVKRPVFVVVVFFLCRLELFIYSGIASSSDNI